MKTIAIIGAGAAGLMTAATILEKYSIKNTLNKSISDITPIHISIFEKNKTPGAKIIISGGGRCNVTTSIADKKILATKYTRGWDFIRKAIGKFSPTKTYEWFESHGVPLKIQADMRVFPVSDDGNDIVDAFEQLFAKYRDNIVLHYGEGVISVASKSFPTSIPMIVDTTEVIRQDVQDLLIPHPPHSNGPLDQDQKYTIITSRGIYEADILVITTGGNAYSHTGSTGDGYAFARSLGHTVTRLGPSLSSFLTHESWIHDLSGLSFENSRIGELHGPILLTHFGISGPLAFMYSSEIAWEPLEKNSSKTIYLSPLADMDRERWESFLKEEFSLHPKKNIKTLLSEKLPKRFVEGFVKEYFSDKQDTYLSSLSKIDRFTIAELLGKGIPLTLIGRRAGDEFVTAGGVCTDQIDPETMESKIQKNLYFAGEILNVDGYTGGFSLQICWSSGYAVGQDIVSKL